ncbi:MAG: TIR domain-containing protein, partial [Chitinophagaceae bacterium]
HAGDGKLAPALQTALENFAKPWFKMRNLNIFRDEASLNASPHLWSNIQWALQQSEYLIYLASPTAAASKWINKEIEYWLQHKSIDTLLIALTDGEILWDDHQKFFIDADINSLPLALEKKFAEEPFYIDLRNSRTQEDLSLSNPIFKKEVLKLAAQLHGKEPKDLASEAVITHTRMMRLRNAVITSLSILFLGAVYAAWFANAKRIEANEKTVEAKVSKDRADLSALYANEQSKVAREQRDRAVFARLQADSAATMAQLQKDTAQMERDNAFVQERIALNEKRTAQANYLLSEAKSASETDPTVGLRLAEAAMKKHPDPMIEAAAYKIYRENSFYKIIGSHKNTIGSVAFSPDGRYVLSASRDSTARIGDLNGNIIHHFRDPSQLRCAAFSPDGRYVLTGSRDGTARLWNLKEKVIREYRGEASVLDVAFSPDGKSILVGSVDSIATLWSIDGRKLRQFNGHSDQVTSVTFSPDGKQVLTGSYDETARLWKLDGSMVRKFENNSIVYSVAFSPDGEFLLAGCQDKSAKMWRINGQKIREFNSHLDAVISVAFSPEGSFILTGSWDKTAVLWEIAGTVIEVFKGSSTWVTAAFSPDGRSIITGGGESASLYNEPGGHTVKIWDARKCYSEFKSKPGVITWEFCPGKDLVLTGCSDSTIRIVTRQGMLVKEISGHTGKVMDIALSPDGKSFVSGSLDSTAKLWNIDGHLIQTFKGHTGIINAVAFSPGGQLILTASEDKTVRVWDVTGKLNKTIIHPGAVRAAAFSPDGKCILTGTSSYGEVARLWKVDGQLVREYFYYDFSYLSTLDFSPDGQSFITGFNNYTAKLWSLTGRLIQEFKGHADAVTAVKFSPDGKMILTGCADGTARLWQRNGNTIQEFRGPAAMVVSVSFTPDKKFILIGSLGNTARVWKVPMPLDQLLTQNKIEYLSVEQKRNVGMEK